MKILFLAPYPPGSAPSQRFRFEHFLPYLEKNGLGYAYHGFLNENGWKILYTKGNVFQKIGAIVSGYLRRWVLMTKVGQYDMVYIHREVAPLGPPIFEWIIANVFKKKIIYDFDDAIWLPNTSEENKWVAALKWHSKVASICRWSWKIAPGNAYLANYARQFNMKVAIFPTVVDTETHSPKITKEENPSPIIGWTGSHSTLAYLNEITPVLQALSKKFTFEFVLIADKDPALALPNYRFVQWQKATEIADLQQLDIGIMPLADDIWAEGKCGFKAIQYLALEIPAVVSPVGVNREIVQHGVHGYHCTTHEAWLEALKQLLSDAILRKKLGKNGRRHIEANYSVASEFERFIGLISMNTDHQS